MCGLTAARHARSSLLCLLDKCVHDYFQIHALLVEYVGWVVGVCLHWGTGVRVVGVGMGVEVPCTLLLP